MIYTLNEKVDYDSVHQTLYGISDGATRHIKLNAPVGRCLLLMINNFGKTLDHRTFIEEVWRKAGMEVAINTLYQNISLLRRALKDCGLYEDIIITVPKQGILFTAHITSREEFTDKTAPQTSDSLLLTDIPANTVERKTKSHFSLKKWILVTFILNTTSVVISFIILIIIARK